VTHFDFLGTWQDSWAILAAILNPGDVTLIVDRRYDQPQPITLTTVDDVRTHCLNGQHKFYVSGTMFSVAPPSCRRIDTGIYEGKYRVEDSRGGPLLVLVLPVCYRYDSVGVATNAFENGTHLHLGPGTLMYQRYYWNEQSQLWERPSDCIKAGHVDLLRRVKTQLVRHTFHVPIWIGKDALQEVENGNATIHGYGLDWFRRLMRSK
jgi:hypothetical protein